MLTDWTCETMLQGMFLLALTACIPGLTPGPEDTASLLQKGLLFGSLYIVALGTGGIKPNVSAFGADQFDESDPQVPWSPCHEHELSKHHRLLCIAEAQRCQQPPE